MTIFDVVVLIIVAVSLIRSVWVGFVRQLAGIAALVLGFMAAGAFSPQAARILSSHIENPRLVFPLAYFLVFAATYMLVIFLGLGVKKVMSVSLLGWLDRTFGALFGLAKGVFFASLLFLLVSSFLSGSNPYLRRSLTYSFLRETSRYLLIFVTDKELRAKLLPSEPAIKKYLPVPPSSRSPEPAKKRPAR